MRQAVPVAKLGALLIRTLAKPVVNIIKRQTAEHPTFKRFCVNAGRRYNGVVVALNTRLLGHQAKEVKVLPEAAAITMGAEVFGETLIFAIGGSVLWWEVARQQEKHAQDMEKKQQLHAAKEEARTVRFSVLESDVAELRERVRVLEAVLAAKEVAGAPTTTGGSGPSTGGSPSSVGPVAASGSHSAFPLALGSAATPQGPSRSAPSPGVGPASPKGKLG